VAADVPAVGDGVVEGEEGVSESEEGDDGDGEGDARLGGQRLVLVPDGVDDLVEVAVGVVGLIGDHLEHPRPVLEHEGKTEVLVLLRNVLLAQLQLVLLVDLQEVALNLLPPLDLPRSGGFRPLRVQPQSLKELTNPNHLQLLLLLPGLFEVLNRS
jgi:hypothetical protein